jgi:hypothetical protein
MEGRRRVQLCDGAAIPACDRRRLTHATQERDVGGESSQPFVVPALHSGVDEERDSGQRHHPSTSMLAAARGQGASS